MEWILTYHLNNYFLFDRWRKIKDRCRIFVKKSDMENLCDIVEENSLTYGSVNDKDIFRLIDVIRGGVNFPDFFTIFKQSSFSLNEWSGFLHLSERTMQRYQKEQKTFDPLASEKILEILLLIRMGKDVFGNNDKFNIWLETRCVALGGKKPKEFLDNTFGIGLLKDELIRIEHGVLA
jgi:putative toxin-antitoxin system antitoxin component (TIGR02293 family)